MRRITAFSLLLGILLLSGCGKSEVPLPKGIVTVHGYLQPVPFSLKRRGTHGLMTASGGTLIAYAESSTVNLRLLEGQEVELEGMLERNTNPDDSPVFVVQKVLSGSAELLRPWKIPALGLSLSLPMSWKGTIKGASATFSISGSTLPPSALTIITRKVPAASSQPLYGPLSVSSASAEEYLLVGLRKAVATVDADGLWIVRVAPPASGGLETVFTFPSLPLELHRVPHRNILKTVTFMTTGGTSSSRGSSVMIVPPASSGSAESNRAQGEGSACGGVAGILCPKGLYCKITDIAGESGVCTKR